MIKITIVTEYIKLDSFLKFCGACISGGEAKEFIKSGAVSVNGESCLMRSKKLYGNDKISFADKEYIIEAAIPQN